jgi:CRP/FNR family cyclic AMP-dependent transcriptional regulator
MRTVQEWSLLEGVPTEGVQTLLKTARRRRFARNEVVFHRDDPGDSMHLIVEGRFAIKITTQLGETLMLGLRGPGEHFGEMAILEGPRRAATVTALEPAETFAVYRDDFDRLRQRYDAIDRGIMRELIDQVRAMDDLLLEAHFLPAGKRVLRRLCDVARLYEGGSPIEVPLTQQQLAELAGTSRETANSVLRKEKERGSLELGRRSTRILDLPALERRAR